MSKFDTFSFGFNFGSIFDLAVCSKFGPTYYAVKINLKSVNSIYERHMINLKITTSMFQALASNGPPPLVIQPQPDRERNSEGSKKMVFERSFALLAMGTRTS